ncbi:MAG: tRNA (adenosine(37)-N6)-threonylcarbamoyltransferase complex transferase subunit TsaD [Candidatus Magasanikbacteria bacterium]
MKILAIESSCDDTSVAFLDATDEKITILAEKTASQIEVHKKYGGVVPEIAGREHAENIMPVVEEVIGKQEKPDVIAVTSGPGLITGLIVGVEVAKALSYLWNVPIVSVNHIEGHIHSPILNNGDVSLKNIKLPAICLTVSGGHTEIVHIQKWGEYKRVGGTRDDAAGETFDKAAKMLGLEYPGGPKISKLALTGNPKAIQFPRPMVHKDTYDFSFAGLKTSALYWLRDNKLKKENSFFSRIFSQKELPSMIFALPSNKPLLMCS